MNFSERLGADLIVMPSHGRSGVPRLLIGSVRDAWSDWPIARSLFFGDSRKSRREAHDHTSRKPNRAGACVSQYRR